MKKAFCDGCGMIRWVNWSKGNRRAKSGEYCAGCYEQLDLAEEASADPGRGASSGPNHNDPSFDNVIRALEEDQ